MPTLASRVDFGNYCLRKLGYPVINIEVTEEQINDRIDEALKLFWEYHMDGNEKMYYKYQLSQKDFPDAVNNIKVSSGGIGYSNSDTITFSPSPRGAQNVTGHIVTFPNGAIQSVILDTNGSGYPIEPTYTINTSTGSGAVLTPELGGWVPIPENVIGVVDIFDFNSVFSNIDNLFSAQYQILSDALWNIGTSSMVPYYMTMTNINLVQDLLVGKQPIRYNRYTNKAYVDMDWSRVTPGNWLIFACHKVIDPEEFTDAWNDRWLQEYATALIKKQWGGHLKKFGNMAGPGGIIYNGKEIFDEAKQELAELDEEIRMNLSLPSNIYMG